MGTNIFSKLNVRCAMCIGLCAFTNILSAQLSVNSVTPKSGHIGTSVTINGSNFDTTTSNNVVFFGATAGTVTACTDSTITVIVNQGASYQDVSVTNTYTKQVAFGECFATTFSCGGVINLTSFGSPAIYPAGNSPRSVAVSDLNGDGYPDVVIANSLDSTISILKNSTGMGGFSLDAPVTLVANMSPQDIVIGDVTGDGKPDIAVVSKDSNSVTVFRNTNTGIGSSISFNQKASYPTGLSPKGIRLADIDKDGRLDIIVANEGDNTVSVYKNTLQALGGVSYDTKIDFPAGASPRSVAVGDIDGDGKPEIITGNYADGTLSVLRNISNDIEFGFESKIDFTTGSGTEKIVVVDFDADGKNDLAVTNSISGTVSIFKNTSSGGVVSFALPIDMTTGTAPIDVQAGDIDGDGVPDLVVANSGSNTVSVFKNTSTVGNISLNTKVDITTLSNPVGIAIADFNGDAKPELGVTNLSGFALSENTIYVTPVLFGINTKTICSGTSVNYTIVPDVPSTYSWSANNNASVTGESLTNQTGSLINDTLYNTTSVSQVVTYPITLTSIGEGCVSTPVTLQVTVLPLPDANAGIDTSITCSNASVLLTGTSTDSSVAYQWTYPDNSSMNLQSITANTAGMYILTVTKAVNSITTCVNTDTVVISLDTVSPIITSPLSYQITTCVPGTITINGTSDNINDSIKWFDQGNNLLSNPATVNTGSYNLWVKRNSNGCIATQLVTVSSQTIFPSIYVPIGLNTNQGVLVLDTLTCTHDSVLLNFQGSTVGAVIKIVRPSPVSDTVLNGSYTTVPGVYTAIIRDTLTGCTGNPLLFQIGEYTTLPQLIMPSVIPPLNCSFTSAVLTGVSGTSNAVLQWTGANGYTSANPATVTQAGDYILNVTHPESGCVKSDTLTLVYENVLAVSGTADTLLCVGDSVQLHGAAIGGVPAFTYSWNNNAGNDSLITVNPLMSTPYILTVTDGNGCSGTDTIMVNIATPITASVLTFHLCDSAVHNGQIQIFAANGFLPYQYSVDDGVNFQSSQVFPNLIYGTYPVVIKDSMNCIHSEPVTVNAQSQMPIPDFIVNTTMMQADSFVVVDISNPRPDSIIWTFPASVTVVDNSNPYSPVIVSSDTAGVDTISMEAHFGSCIMYLTKPVQFIKPDTLAPSPHGNGIDSLTVYPNPNSGEFSVEVTLFKKQKLAIYVYNSGGVEQVRVVLPDTDYTLNTISLPNPVPEMYLLKVVAEYDAEWRTIVVTQ